MNADFRRKVYLCIAARTRLYTIAGMTVVFGREGRDEIVALFRLIVILPDLEKEDRRPEVSLASKDEVIGLYRARE